MISIKIKKQNSGGFTILETLVAITIILIAITGPLDIIAHSLKASYYSRDEVTAFYLAQEAIEYARNQRDNNELNLNSTIDQWLDNAVPPDCLNNADETSIKKCVLLQDTEGNYQYDPCTGNCADNESYRMKRFSNTGVMGAVSGDEDTNFTREIYFTKVVDRSVVGDTEGQTRNEILVTVNVYWSNSFGSNNKFTLSTRLYNWKIIAE